MADTGLARLYSLHLVDAQLVALKARASGLDAGQAELALAKQAQSELATITDQAAAARKLANECEEKIRSLQSKADSHEKQLYAGQVDAHHIEAMQADIEASRAKAAEEATRLGLLKSAAQEEESKRDSTSQKFDDLRRAVAKKRKVAEAMHTEIQSKFKELVDVRPGKASDVPKNLLDAYEVARKRTGGIGIAVITPESMCGACGVLVPEKSRDAASRDQVVTCQSCHRILFVPVPSL